MGIKTNKLFLWFKEDKEFIIFRILLAFAIFVLSTATYIADEYADCKELIALKFCETNQCEVIREGNTINLVDVPKRDNLREFLITSDEAKQCGR